jgi:hypothetical protein
VHETLIKRNHVALQQLCDILHKRFPNGTCGKQPVTHK